MLARTVLALVLTFVAFGCKKQKAETSDENAAPSSSIVSIAVGMAFCDDPALCQKECDGGNHDACRRLGVSYELGKGGVARDEAKALALYEKACAMKNPMACTSAGHLIEFGKGTAKDDARAASFYKSSCEQGYPGGCYNYALMAELGRGVPQDDLEAARYYDRACAAGSQQACAKAKELRDRAASAPRIDAGAHD